MDIPAVSPANNAEPAAIAASSANISAIIPMVYAELTPKLIKKPPTPPLDDVPISIAFLNSDADLSSVLNISPCATSDQLLTEFIAPDTSKFPKGTIALPMSLKTLVFSLNLSSLFAVGLKPILLKVD